MPFGRHFQPKGTASAAPAVTAGIQGLTRIRLGPAWEETLRRTHLSAAAAGQQEKECRKRTSAHARAVSLQVRLQVRKGEWGGGFSSIAFRTHSAGKGVEMDRRWRGEGHLLGKIVFSG